MLVPALCQAFLVFLKGPNRLSYFLLIINKLPQIFPSCQANQNLTPALLIVVSILPGL